MNDHIRPRPAFYPAEVVAMGILTRDAGWLFSPVAHVRWSTVLAAAAVFGVAAVASRRPLRALIATIAWLAVYEIAWQGFDLLMHRATSATDPVHFAWLAAALVAWPGWASAIGIRPDWRWTGLSAAAFAIWVAATGFDYNYFGQTKPLQVAPEVLNVISKTSLAVAYLLGALRSGISGAPSLAGATTLRQLVSLRS